jgi:putative PIN family toxin of toxin-antitoxin system
MRVVLDTNVLVSALIFPGGKPETVYRRALDGAIVLITTGALLAELGRVLETKFGWAATRVEEVVAQIVRVGEVAKSERRLAVIAADPADNAVLEAAIAGRAALIVSGDSHLLDLGVYGGIRILDPAGFLAEFGASTLR